MTDSDSGAALAEPADDLRASIEAAIDQVSGDAPEAPAEEAAGSARDDRGRFAKGESAPEEDAEAPKGEAADEETKDQPAEAEKEEPAPPAIDPPASWSAAEKAHWAKLPREAQDAILRRESDVARGFQQKADEARAYEPLRQAISPHLTRITSRGQNPAELVKQLLDVHAGLESTPYEVFPVIARMYGIDLNRIAPGEGAQAAMRDDGSNPMVSHLTQTVQQMQERLRQTEQFLTQQQQAEIAAHQARATQEFNAFTEKASTEYPHFETVRHEMGKLIEAGISTTLQDAYERAVWARPEIRQRIQEDQRKAEEAKRLEDQRKSVAAAKARAGSVKSNPTAAPKVSGDVDDLRAVIERAWDG